MAPQIVVLQHPRVDIIRIIHWIVGGSPSIMTVGIIDGKLCLWINIGCRVDSKMQVSGDSLIFTYGYQLSMKPSCKTGSPSL